jgi:large subunit ribosomal protein L24
MAAHIRKNDMVEVISGDHRGARGKILLVDPGRRKVVIEGVNLVFRHVRPTRRNPQGGRVQKEAAVHMSNVLPLDTAKGKGSRVRFETDGGHKRRVTVGGSALHTLTHGDAGSGK